MAQQRKCPVQVLRRLNINQLDQILAVIDQLITKRSQTNTMCQTEDELVSNSTAIFSALETDSCDKALNRIETLKAHARVLQNVGRCIGARRMADVSQEVERLLKMCDEQLAARKIVGTLQSLLNVSSIERILPAIRERLAQQISGAPQ